MNTINKATLELIKSFEGLELKAYKDAVGVWTIGYGHTSMAGPPTVKAGMKITEQEAEDLLLQDLKKYEKGVKKYVKVPLNDNQYGALVSFCYNLGEGNLGKSTLVKRINNKDFIGASREFAKWDKAGGKVLRGLTRRREAEKNLFLTPINNVVILDPQKPVQPLPDNPGVLPSEKPKTSLWAILVSLFGKLFGRK